MDIRIPFLFLPEPPPQHPVQIDAFFRTLRNTKTVIKFIAGKNCFFALRCFLMVAAGQKIIQNGVESIQFPAVPSFRDNVPDMFFNGIAFPVAPVCQPGLISRLVPIKAHDVMKYIHIAVPIFPFAPIQIRQTVLDHDMRHVVDGIGQMMEIRFRNTVDPRKTIEFDRVKKHTVSLFGYVIKVCFHINRLLVVLKIHFAGNMSSEDFREMFKRMIQRDSLRFGGNLFLDLFKNGNGGSFPGKTSDIGGVRGRKIIDYIPIPGTPQNIPAGFPENI